MKTDKLIYSFLVIFLTVFNISCNENRQKIASNQIPHDSLIFTHLRINPKEFKGNKISSLARLPSHLKISSFAHSIEYVPLETNDSVLIGRIDKIIKRGNKIFIQDRMTESIFCFDTEGKFLYKLSEKGDGPGEYYAIQEFNVIENEQIVIYSSGQGLYFYSENGFIKKINTSIISSDFYIENDTIFFYIGRNLNNIVFKEYPTQYRLINTINNKIIGEYLPYTHTALFSQIPLPTRNFFMSQDTLNLIDYLNQETYCIVNGEVAGKYKFEFSTNKNTLNYNNSGDINNSIVKKIKEGDYTSLLLFLESDNYIFINYAIDGLIMESYITKKDFEVNNVGLFYFDDFNGISFGGSMLSVDSNELIATIEPGNLIELTKKNDNLSENVRVVKNQIDPSGNPVIIIMDLK